MQISKETHTSTKPLDLPEIRARVASFLDNNDRASCMRVSRDWFQDFAPSVWHTTDFKTDVYATSKSTPEVLDKYGSFFSEVHNITNMSHLRSIQHHNVNALKSIQVHLSRNPQYQEMLSDLLLRCGGSIRSLDICYPVPTPDSWKQQREQPENYARVADIIATSAFSPSADGRITTGRGSCLRTLKLEYACLTRESFSTLLRGSPSLNEMTLCRVVVMGHKATIPLYTGSNLRYLSASLNQATAMDTDDKNAPSLLLHFPLLKEWNISWVIPPSHWRTGPVYEDFSTWCPDLKTITFGNKGAELISNLLINTFQNVEFCILFSKNLTPSTALGFIAHQTTLTSVTVKGVMEDSTWTQWFHMIPRLCTKLQVLSLVSLSFDSKRLDTFQWECKDLRVLRVQFEGLEFESGIDECLNQLCDWRRFGRGALVPHKNMMNAETRVCQFLFQFKSLKSVWLGKNDCYLPPFCD